MNILVTTGDGPDSYGLKILQEAVRQSYRNARVVHMTTTQPYYYSGTATTMEEDVRNLPREQPEPDHYVIKGTPVDLLYLALGHPELFLPRKEELFNLVAVGVHAGACVGTDVFHASSGAMACLTGLLGATAGFSFSQELDPDKDLHAASQYANAERLVPAFFQQTAPMPGEVWNVNFPRTTHPKGWRPCPVAAYSTRRRFTNLPATEALDDDVQNLRRGWATISPLELRINPPTKY